MIAPEVKGLLDRASENLEAARLLQQNDYPEIAASRVYYAMFYAAEGLLLARNQTYTSHSAVIAAFGREFAKTGDLDARFHRALIDAQDLRHSGDYGSGPAVALEQVEEALHWAEEFVAAAKALLEQGQEGETQ